MPRLLSAVDPEALAEAVGILDRRQVVVYPTDTLYGLGADALDEEAVVRVFDVKGRPPDVALPVLLGSFEDAHHVARVTPLARRLAARFLPGPVTLVLPALATVPDALLGGESTVAVRVVDQPFARALAAHFGPITATSANRHGHPPAAPAAAAASQLGDRVGLYVDAGPLPGTASTIVDASGDEPRILRAGAVPEAVLLGV